MRASVIIIGILIIVTCTVSNASALAGKGSDSERGVESNSLAYRVQPGDILQVSAWREADMQLEVLVTPDGAFTIPLAGEIVAKDKTIKQISQEITVKLKQYMPDQAITVAVKQPLGNIVYIIGKVNKAGPVLMTRPLDVVQALSAAGGFTRFAVADEIKVIRRINNKQTVFNVDYSEIENGKNLPQNIVLKSGDIVVVP